MSISREMNKEDVIHIYNAILLSHKNNKITPFAATWVDLEIVILREVNQTKKDKYHTISLIPCSTLVEPKKRVKMNLSIKPK